MININSPNQYNSSNDFLNDAGFINFFFKLDARDESILLSTQVCPQEK